MKAIIKSRRINTPCDFNPKNSNKKISKNIISELLTLPNNATESSYKEQNPLQSNSHYENRNEAQKKPPKEVLIPMHKTTIKWGLHEYGGKNTRKKDYCNKQRKCNVTRKLPELSFKENTKFNPNPTSEKRDEYIRYIISNKKSKLEGKNNNRSRCRKGINPKTKGDFSIDLARRDSILSSDSSEVRSFNFGGISFEVHSKGDGSSMNSLEHLESNISKEMSLMFYDFNGAKSRVSSNSPKQENVLNNDNIVVEYLFQQRGDRMPSSLAKKANTQHEPDDKRSKSPPIFMPLTNNSIFLIATLSRTKA